jgi:hypothetical protein
MSPRTLVGVLVILISGCATVEQVNPHTPTAPTPTCKGAVDCDTKWSAARSYLISHAAYELQNDSVDRLETFNPANEATVGLRAQVNKSLQPDGSYAIVAKFWCNNLVVCTPAVGPTLSDFNRTVAEAGTPAPAGSPSVAGVIPASDGPGTPPRPEANNAAVINPPGAGTATLGDARANIEAGERAWAERLPGSDPSVLQRILADDCVWIQDGRTKNKAGAVAAAGRGPAGLTSSHLDYATIRVFSDAAIAQGSSTWTRQDGTAGHVIWTDTWLRRNGQWQIVAAQDTTL